MRSIHVAMVAVALTIPLPSVAQSGATTSGTANATSQENDQVTPKKKKGGLFGKVKGLAKNKVVQTVAKAAACNMVPGGQLVVGALDNVAAKKAAKNAAADAAKNAATGAAQDVAVDAAKNVAVGAAKNAAVGAVKNAAVGAVAGAALGGAGGSPCGMGMMGNLAGGGGPTGVPGVGMPGMPTTGLAGAGMSAGQMKQMEEQYRKMGMKPEQIKAMQQQMQAGAAGASPTGMPAMGMSPDQMKQMMEQYRKMGIDPAQLAEMEKMMAATRGGAEAEQPIETAAAAVAPVPATAPSLTKEKGKLVLRQLPWAPGSETTLPGAEPTFGLAIRDLATTILNGSARYKVEARVEDQGSKGASRALAQKRAGVVIAALVGEGVPQPRLVAADGGSDKDPKLVISETK